MDPPRNTAGGAGRIPALLAAGLGHARDGKPAAAANAFTQILSIDGDDVDALNNLGVLYALGGKFAEAIPCFEKALAVAPEDAELRRNLVEAYFYDGRNRMDARDYAGALADYRKLIGLDPAHAGGRVNLGDMLSSTKVKAEIGDFAPHLTGAALGTHVLVACMPKSGSSFLTTALRNLTGWPRNFLSFAYRQNEEEIYLPGLVAMATENTITQQHCRATDANIQLLQAFGIRPVVLVRNLFDIVVSLKEFYDIGAVHNTFFVGRWERLETPRRFDLIVDHVIPWYLAFFASWIDAARAERLDCLLVTYEQMIADKPGTLKAICDYQGIDKSAEACAEAVGWAEGERVRTRKNKGVAGRGEDALSAEQKARIARLAACYHDIDLSPIGL